MQRAPGRDAPLPHAFRQSKSLSVALHAAVLYATARERMDGCVTCHRRAARRGALCNISTARCSPPAGRRLTEDGRDALARCDARLRAGSAQDVDFAALMTFKSELARYVSATASASDSAHGLVMTSSPVSEISDGDGAMAPALSARGSLVDSATCVSHLLVIGNARTNCGDLVTAVDAFTRAIEADPERIEGYMGRGTALALQSTRRLASCVHIRQTRVCERCIRRSHMLPLCVCMISRSA